MLGAQLFYKRYMPLDQRVSKHNKIHLKNMTKILFLYIR